MIRFARGKYSGLRLWLQLSALMLCPSVAAQACSVCFGDPNNPQSHALNQAILVLLGVMILVLSSVVAFAVRVARRARALEARDVLDCADAAGSQVETIA